MMSPGQAESVRYIAQTFLAESHYKILYETLARKWDRLHSLSAAVRLMQTYGVELSEEELASLSGMDEGQQINALVAKMPKQSNDQFQHFFLQLQLLVSTAMRVRRALEEGRPDEVAQALEDADATGIATYILRVAVVQAGNEVSALKNNFELWRKEADMKMGRLIRGQQDALAAQKKLAHAQAELDKHTRISNTRSSKFVLAFAATDDKALMGLVFNNYVTIAKVLAMERRVEEEYSLRMTKLENNMVEFKVKQLEKNNNTIMKQWRGDQAELQKETFAIWRREAEDQKFLRDSATKVEEMQHKLANAKASQRENAKKVLASFSQATERGLLELAVQVWREEVKESKLQQNIVQEQSTFENKLKDLSRAKREKLKGFMCLVAGSSDSGCLSMALQTWQEFVENTRTEKALETELEGKVQKLAFFAEHNKKNGMTAVSKAAEAVEAAVLIRHFGTWRTWARMESVMRKHHSLIDAKRSQLVGVQQMFRDFAKQLEAGVKAEGPSTRAFDQPGRNTPTKRLSKTDVSSSLPDIHKSSSGRRGRDASKSAGSPPKQGSQG